MFSWPLLFLSALENISSTSSLVQATPLSWVEDLYKDRHHLLTLQNQTLVVFYNTGQAEKRCQISSKRASRASGVRSPSGQTKTKTDHSSCHIFIHAVTAVKKLELIGILTEPKGLIVKHCTTILLSFRNYKCNNVISHHEKHSNQLFNISLEKKSKDFLFVRIKHVHPSVLLQQSGAIREDLKKYGFFLFPFLKVFIVSA